MRAASRREGPRLGQVNPHLQQAKVHVNLVDQVCEP